MTMSRDKDNNESWECPSCRDICNCPRCRHLRCDNIGASFKEKETNTPHTKTVLPEIPTISWLGTQPANNTHELKPFVCNSDTTSKTITDLVKNSQHLLNNNDIVDLYLLFSDLYFGRPHDHTFTLQDASYFDKMLDFSSDFSGIKRDDELDIEFALE